MGMSRSQTLILDEIFMTSRALVEMEDDETFTRLAEELRSRRRELLSRLRPSKNPR